MEDPALDSPIDSPLPQAGRDPDDPLRPEVEEENSATIPPIGAPHFDTELGEDNPKDDLSDDESVLSDIDEAQFEDFDPTAIAVETRPVAVDESNVALLGTHKRKRAEGEADGTGKKKKKREKGEKPKKVRKPRDEDDNFSGGEELEGKRIRKKKGVVEKREKPRLRRPSPENEEELTPEERRKRALDRAMDDAVRNHNQRRKKLGGIDLEAQNDDLIEDVRRRMTEAAKADTDARQNGQPAMQKLKMLPEVVALLNRNTLKDQLVDPDTNLLEAVRFFLEPLNDGSLPAYNIQRELFAALAKLPITKDSLVASGIGKVTLFYTKSQKPEAKIKRQAERLLGEWTRPILKRTDDYRKKRFGEPPIDHGALPVRASQQISSQAAAANAARERALAMPVQTNRARVDGGISSYDVVPRNNTSSQIQFARPVSAGGEEAFKRLKARQQTKPGTGGRRQAA